MTDEHEHAMKVWREALAATGNFVRFNSKSEKDAAAVIAADRAGLVAEVERLVQAWEAQHKEKVKEREEARLWFEKAQKWAEENARLREALERIATVDMGGGFLGALACQKVARAALKDTRHDADA